MSTRQILKRVSKLENLICPQSDGNTSHTLEELCRSSWRHDKKRFMEMAKDTGHYGLFVHQFQREDAEAAAARRSTRV
jgi:hypothetical protein